MTIRAVILGLLLGLGIAAATYFNDWVVLQTQMVGNLLPISVFGVLMLLLLIVCPLLGPRGARFSFRPIELAAITAISLAVCGWPGSGFGRYFVANLAMPANWLKSKPAWQAANVMAYVPGGAWTLGEGHVLDWEGLAQELAAAGAAGKAGPERRVWDNLGTDAQAAVKEVAASGHRTSRQIRIFWMGLNRVITTPDFFTPVMYGGQGVPEPVERVVQQEKQRWLALERQQTRAVARYLLGLKALPESLGPQAQKAAAEPSALGEAGMAAFRRQAAEAALPPAARIQLTALLDQQAARRAELRSDQGQELNRAVLVNLFPRHILPRPQGEGVLLLGGRTDPQVTDNLVQGQPTRLWGIPWKAWWPSIKLWGGLALLLGLGALGLSLVVHPQWARRELLAYPVPKFVNEIIQRSPGRWLPDVAGTWMFWIGFGVVFLIHLINGLNVWFPDRVFIKIPLMVDMGSLRSLFPTLATAPNSWALFFPRLYPSVMAFAFFLTTEVSLSLGVSLVVWAIFTGTLVSNGVSFYGGWSQANPMNTLWFGSWLGIGLVVLYTGRRHYASVARASIGLRHSAETPAYSVWGARLLVLCVLASVALLGHAGLDWVLALPLVGVILLIFLVIARVNAETGVFFVQTNWLPMAMLTAVFGMQAVGPTAYIVMAIASFAVVADPREAIMPYLTNGLQIMDSAGASAGPQEKAARGLPQRVVPWQALVIVAGLAITIVSVLYWQYNRGLATHDSFARDAVGTMAFDRLSEQVSNLEATGGLQQSMLVSGWQRLTHLQPNTDALWWIGLGTALVVGCTLARLRLSWWPLHPVMFVFWGTYPCNQFAFSFLCGWLVKWGVTKVGGARAYHRIKPLMVGIISGELSAGLAWMIAGAVWFACTGLSPRVYQVFPG